MIVVKFNTRLMSESFLFDYSDKKINTIPEDVWDAATTAEVTVVNLSKNVLTQVPIR